MTKRTRLAKSLAIILAITLAPRVSDAAPPNLVRVVSVSRPPLEVWTALSDFEKYPEWAPTVTSVSAGGESHEGATWKVTGGRNTAALEKLCDRNKTACSYFREVRFPVKAAAFSVSSSMPDKRFVVTIDRSQLNLPPSIEPGKQNFEVIVEVHPAGDGSEVVVTRSFERGIQDPDFFSSLAMTLAVLAGDERNPLEMTQYRINGEADRFSRADIWACTYKRKPRESPECQAVLKALPNTSAAVRSASAGS